MPILDTDVSFRDSISTVNNNKTLYDLKNIKQKKGAKQEKNHWNKTGQVERPQNINGVLKR